MCFIVNTRQSTWWMEFKFMKTNTLLDYAQAHANICCVLMRLRFPYGEAHKSYDQTHGPYGETHGLQSLPWQFNYLNPNGLPIIMRFGGGAYMEWFMVWINLTKGNAANGVPDGSGWFGVCLPIKTAALYGFDRKSLEQNACVMLQKQRMHFVF